MWSANCGAAAARWPCPSPSAGSPIRDRQQVEGSLANPRWSYGERCAPPPGVRQRHHVIDLYQRRRVLPALNLDPLPGVRPVQHAGEDHYPVAGPNARSCRSRFRMSLRVSQPLRPNSTPTSSDQACLNRSRSYQSWVRGPDLQLPQRLAGLRTSGSAWCQASGGAVPGAAGSAGAGPPPEREGEGRHDAGACSGAVSRCPGSRPRRDRRCRGLVDPAQQPMPAARPRRGRH